MIGSLMADRVGGADLGRAARSYRVARRLIRVISVLGFTKRKAIVERILRRLFGDLVEADGHFLEVDPRDRSLGSRLRRTGIWSATEKALFEQELRPGMVAIDIGANVGYFTLLAARLVGPAGRVYAFEPEPNNFELLRRNVARNGYQNVATVQTALSRRSGAQRLFKSNDNFGDHRLMHGPRGRSWIDVPVITLDEFFAGFAGSEPSVGFLKLDIQGAELAALQGARRLITASPPVSLLTEFWPDGMRAFGDDPEEYLRELQAFGFSIAIITGRSRPRLHRLEDAGELRRLCALSNEVNLFCRKG